MAGGEEETAVVPPPPGTLFRELAYLSPNPDTFWPERWLLSSAPKRTPARAQAQVGVVGATSFHHGGGASTSEKSSNPDALEVMTNTAAFIPFSYGPANCAGWYLALLIQRF